MSAPKIPDRVCAELRLSLPAPQGRRLCRIQAEAARLLGTAKRTVERWEADAGAPLMAGWAYVGVAFRLGGAEAAQKTLEVLAQLPLEGSAIWGLPHDRRAAYERHLELFPDRDGEEDSDG